MTDAELIAELRARGWTDCAEAVEAGRRLEPRPWSDFRRNANGDGWIIEMYHAGARFTDIDIFDDGEVLMSTGGKDEEPRVFSNKPRELQPGSEGGRGHDA